MLYSPEELQKLRIFHVYFWDNKQEPIKVAPREAAMIKAAIRGGFNYFELGEDLYMVKNIRAIKRDERFIEDHEIGKNIENPEDMKFLTTGFYLQSGKLMELSGPPV